MASIEIGNNLTQIVLSGFTLLGTIVTGLFVYLARKESKDGIAEANRSIAEVKDGMQSKMIEAKQAEAVAVSLATGLAAGEAKEQARTAP